MHWVRMQEVPKPVYALSWYTCISGCNSYLNKNIKSFMSLLPIHCIAQQGDSLFGSVHPFTCLHYATYFSLSRQLAVPKMGQIKNNEASQKYQYYIRVIYSTYDLEICLNLYSTLKKNKVGVHLLCFTTILSHFYFIFNETLIEVQLNLNFRVSCQLITQEGRQRDPWTLPNALPSSYAVDKHQYTGIYDMLWKIQ